jgi:DNA-binding FrmR family transcriptional regulator
MMEMKLDNPETKEKMIQRLKRVEGQIRGVQAMMGEERDCREIMQQLAAVNSAVKSASRVFFREYAAACMAEMGGGEDPSEVKRDRMVQEMINLLDKTP